MARPKTKGGKAYRTQVGDRLHARRLQCNLTQRQVGDTLKVEPQTISGWERGAYLPDAANQMALAKLYNVSLEWILSGGDPPSDMPAKTQRKKRAGGGLTQLDRPDLDVMIGEAAERVLDLYTAKGFELTVKEAVIQAFAMMKDGEAITSDAAAQEAINTGLERLNRFLATLPRRKE